MTDQPKTALDQLLATAERLNAILKEHGAVASARQMPQTAVRRIGEVSIRAGEPYYNRSPEPEAVAAAQEIQSRLKAQLISAAERERDAQLCALAAELTAIRSTLPSLAARAAIELGITSRALFAEAQAGSA